MLVSQRIITTVPGSWKFSKGNTGIKAMTDPNFQVWGSGFVGPRANLEPSPHLHGKFL